MHAHLIRAVIIISGCILASACSTTNTNQAPIANQSVFNECRALMRASVSQELSHYYIDKNYHVIFNNVDMGTMDSNTSEVVANADHIAFMRDGNILYDGKIIDQGSPFSIKLSGDAILYQKNNKIYCNKKYLGTGFNLVINNNNIAFQTPRIVQTPTAENSDVIHNGINLGHSINGSKIKLDGEHIGFVREEHGKIYFVYDGKQLGEMYPAPQNQQSIYIEYENDFHLAHNQVAYIRIIAGEKHVIFNNTDLGVAQTLYQSSSKKIFDNQEMLFMILKDNITHMYFNGKDVGEFDHANYKTANSRQFIAGKHVIFIDRHGFVRYDGREVGKAPARGWQSRPGAGLDGDSYFFTNNNDEVIFNGKNLGKLFDFALRDGHTMEIRKAHRMYSGMPIAVSVGVYDGREIAMWDGNPRHQFQMDGDHIAYTNNLPAGLKETKLASEYTEIFLDGEKIDQHKTGVNYGSVRIMTLDQAVVYYEKCTKGECYVFRNQQRLIAKATSNHTSQDPLSRCNVISHHGVPHIVHLESGNNLNQDKNIYFDGQRLRQVKMFDLMNAPSRQYISESDVVCEQPTPSAVSHDGNKILE